MHKRGYEGKSPPCTWRRQRVGRTIEIETAKMNVRVTERCEKSCKSQNGEGHNDGCKRERNYTCAKTQIGEAI